MGDEDRITVTIKWREVANRESAISVPKDTSSEEITKAAADHANRTASGVIVVEAISWETSEVAARFGGLYGQRTVANGQRRPSGS